MGLHLAHLAREPVPRDPVEPLPTHVAVGASVVRAREPSVLAFKVLEDVQTWLERVGEREREEDGGRKRGCQEREGIKDRERVEKEVYTGRRKRGGESYSGCFSQKKLREEIGAYTP